MVEYEWELEEDEKKREREREDDQGQHRAKPIFTSLSLCFQTLPAPTLTWFISASFVDLVKRILGGIWGVFMHFLVVYTKSLQISNPIGLFNEATVSLKEPLIKFKIMFLIYTDPMALNKDYKQYLFQQSQWLGHRRQPSDTSWTLAGPWWEDRWVVGVLWCWVKNEGVSPPRQNTHTHRLSFILSLSVCLTVSRTLSPPPSHSRLADSGSESPHIVHSLLGLQFFLSARLEEEKEEGEGWDCRSCLLRFSTHKVALFGQCSFAHCGHEHHWLEVNIQTVLLFEDVGNSSAHGFMRKIFKYFCLLFFHSVKKFVFFFG